MIRRTLATCDFSSPARLCLVLRRLLVYVCSSVLFTWTAATYGITWRYALLAQQYLPSTSLTSGLLDSHASAFHCLCVLMMLTLCVDVHAMCVLTMVYLCMDGCAMQLGDEVRFSAEAPPVWLFDKIPSTSNGEGSSGTSGN